MPLLYLPDYATGGTHSVAINCQGSQVVVGVPTSKDGENYGVVYILDSQTGEAIHTLRQPCARRDNEFGLSVAASCEGRMVLVGAKDSSGLAQHSAGVVYLFAIVDETKAHLLQTFHNPDPQDFDDFGIVLAMDAAGETIAIASPNHNENNGAVYVFNKNGDLIRTLIPPILAEDTLNNPGVGNNFTEGQFFGASIAMSADGNLLLVGAPGNGTRQLRGLVFLFDTHSGELVKTIHNPAPRRSHTVRVSRSFNSTLVEEEEGDSLNHDLFASSVAISDSGNRIVVGARSADPTKKPAIPRAETGLVYVFNIHGDLLKYYSSPNNQQRGVPIVQDNFGISVSTDANGNQILVGAPHSTPNEDNRTAVAFLFHQGEAHPAMYNPIADTASGEPIIFGEAAVLARSGEYAIISSAFHPVVQVVCLKTDGSCPLEDLSRLETRSSSQSSPEYEKVVSPFGSSFQDSQQECLDSVSDGGSAGYSVKPLDVLWIGLASIFLVGVFFALQRWLQGCKKKPTTDKPVVDDKFEDENIHPRVLSPSEKAEKASAQLPEIL